MAKTKIYFPNFEMLGRSFDGKFCAKTNKEAAERLGVSMYYLNNYVNRRELFEGEEAFEEFWVKPYGYSAKRDLGYNRGWMLKETAEKELKVIIQKIQHTWK